MANQSQPPENQAAARERRRLAEIRTWSRLAADMERSREQNHLPPLESKTERRLRSDIDYLLSLLDAVSGVVNLDRLEEIASPPLQQPASERCGECGKSVSADWRFCGYCSAFIGTATGAGEGEQRDRLLRDAGAILCVNDPDAGAKVEIRFAELKDAQRLHATLVQSRADSPAPAAEGEAPNRCPACGEAKCFDHELQTMSASMPSTATTSDSVREIAVEILEWLNFDTSLDAVQADVYGVWAIVYRHLPDAGEVERLKAERLEIQRALASTVLDDPSEDDSPPYTTTEIVHGITSLEQRRRSAVRRAVEARADAKRDLAEKVLAAINGERLHNNLNNEGDKGYMRAIRDVAAAVQRVFTESGVEVEGSNDAT